MSAPFDYGAVRALISDVEIAGIIDHALRTAPPGEIAIMSIAGTDWVYWEEGISAAIDDAGIAGDCDADAAYLAAMVRMVWTARARGESVRPPSWLVDVLIGLVGVMLADDTTR